MRHNTAAPAGIFSAAWQALPIIVRMKTATARDSAAFGARLGTLSEVLTADVAAGAIPGAVAAVHRGGELAYFEAFGFADRPAGRAMQRDSLFRIASMTKPITVTAALLLQERGKLLLTDPAARYLPELGALAVGVESVDPASGELRLTLEAAARPMTVQDLMRHTAGFTYGQFGDSLVQKEYVRAKAMDPQQTNARMMEKLAGVPLRFQPGTTFEYGMSTDVLGRLVEVVADMSLDRFIARHITGPLGMVDTGFVPPPNGAHRLAQPHRDVPLPAAAPPTWFSGGGGLLSTTGDYLRFCRMLMNGGELEGVRLLSRKTVELMTHNHLPPGTSYGTHTPELGLAAPLPRLGQGYGLGLGVRMLPGLSGAPGSVGDYYWGGASGPYFWVDPAEQLITVFMLQELDVQRRTRYRPLLRALVYQALP
jgi:CubicO group peptidase (beta-lactamase class C family)